MRTISVFFTELKMPTLYKKAALILLLSFIIFTPPIAVFNSNYGFSLKFEYIFSLIGLFFFIKSKPNIYHLNTILIILLLIPVSMLFTLDFYYLKNFLFILKNFFKYYLAFHLMNYELRIQSPLTYLGVVTLPYIFSIFIFQHNPSYAEYWFSFFQTPEAHTILIGPMRISWIGGQTWDHAIFLMTIYFLMLLFIEDFKFLVQLTMIGVFLGAVVSARTWIVTYVLCFLFLLYPPSRLKKAFFSLLHLAAVIALTVVIYRLLIITEHNFLYWVWEFAYNILHNNPQITHSVTDLNNQNVSFLQSTSLDIKTILLGDGKYVQIQDGILKYYGGRDSGYIRELLCVGGLFSGLLYLLYILAILKSYTFRQHTRIAWFFIITFFIYQIKGDILFAYFAFFLFVDLILKHRDLVENEHLQRTNSNIP